MREICAKTVKKLCKWETDVTTSETLMEHQMNNCPTITSNNDWLKE